MTCGALPGIPTVAQQITFFSSLDLSRCLSIPDHCLQHLLFWNLVFTFNICYCGLTIFLCFYVKQHPRLRHTGPRPCEVVLTPGNLHTSILDTCDPGQTIHSLLLCSFRWRIFSGVREKCCVTTATSSPSVSGSITCPRLEVKWKVLHNPQQRRWREPTWQPSLPKTPAQTLSPKSLTACQVSPCSGCRRHESRSWPLLLQRLHTGIHLVDLVASQLCWCLSFWASFIWPKLEGLFSSQCSSCLCRDPYFNWVPFFSPMKNFI